jgi:tRNA threonylcarbamoyladenosine biosynthesis protein TsaB
MPLLLNIDTATGHASVCLSKGDVVLGMIESTEQKNHASFVQPAISELMAGAGYTLNALDGIAVTAGPGSYTGLRVGLASAKGICYALNKPLILINTLEVMAQAVVSRETSIDPSTLICPLIDARRMEVFTALYDSSLHEIEPPHALVVDENSFAAVLKVQSVVFSGSGHAKLKEIIVSPAAIFSAVQHHAGDLAVRALKAYQSKLFADLAYSEPLYVKEFFNPPAKAIKQGK